MELKSKRIFKGGLYTISKLYVDGVYECDVLEDTDRGLSDSMELSEIKKVKQYGKTAIPTGTYAIDMDTVSPKFKDRIWAKVCDGKLPLLQNVKGFSGVLIHVGNTPEDTLGCLLVGFNKVKGQVVNSTDAFKKLYEKMKEAHDRGESINLTIE